MLKVEKLRHDCRSDKCKKGVVHWCVLMGEMRVVTDVLVIYGFDPEPDLTNDTNKDDKNNVLVKEATQFLTQYDDAIKRQESKASEESDMKDLYRKIQRMTKFAYTKQDKNGGEKLHQVTNA